MAASLGIRALLLAAISCATCRAALATTLEDTSCPTARQFLTCVDPFYKLPNMTNILLASKTPALSLIGFKSGLDLRRILPWNDVITLTYRRTDHAIYKCQYPIFQGSQLLAYAANASSPYSKMCTTCPRSPMLTGRQNYYVTGAMQNVGLLTKAAVKNLPELQAWKTFYTKVAPNLSMCLTINPCLMNVFLGISGLQYFVNVRSEGVVVDIKPQKYSYSYGVDFLPPDWRAATPSFFVMDPAAFNFTGFFYPVDRLTIARGRTFVAGALSSTGGSVVNLPCATLSLGGQKDSWTLYRDSTRVAVSLSLPAAPIIRLWNALDLNLWQPNGGVRIRNVQLLTRYSTCQFWLSGPVQDAPVRLVVSQIPAIGYILQQIYQNVDQKSNLNRISSFDIYLAGSKGASLRLGMGPGVYPLTAAAQLRFNGQLALNGPHTLVFTAVSGASTFSNGATVQQGIKNTPVHFCNVVDDCPIEYEYCDEVEGVCLPADLVGAAAAAATIQGEDDVASMAAAGSSKPADGSQLMGEACSRADQCSSGLRCSRGLCAE